MIEVIYKKENENGATHIPYKNIGLAKEAAKTLFEKGYLGVKVSEVNEEILYIPEK